jgi:hypothetical protein
MYMHKDYLVDYILYQNGKLFFCPVLPDIQISLSCLKFPTLRPLVLIIREVVRKKVNVELWWNNAVRGNRSSGRRTCLIVTLSTTNPTWNSLRSSPAFRIDSPIQLVVL